MRRRNHGQPAITCNYIFKMQRIRFSHQHAELNGDGVWWNTAMGTDTENTEAAGVPTAVRNVCNTQRVGFGKLVSNSWSILHLQHWWIWAMPDYISKHLNSDTFAKPSVTLYFGLVSSIASASSGLWIPSSFPSPRAKPRDNTLFTCIPVWVGDSTSRSCSYAWITCSRSSDCLASDWWALPSLT